MISSVQPGLRRTDKPSVTTTLPKLFCLNFEKRQPMFRFKIPLLIRNRLFVVLQNRLPVSNSVTRSAAFIAERKQGPTVKRKKKSPILSISYCKISIINAPNENGDKRKFAFLTPLLTIPVLHKIFTKLSIVYCDVRQSCFLREMGTLAGEITVMFAFVSLLKGSRLSLFR